ncbi:hypothetical protein [Nocardia sp. CS682]|nr:hypothetical protein [Nocardia sp. CS682]
MVGRRRGRSSETTALPGVLKCLVNGLADPALDGASAEGLR